MSIYLLEIGTEELPASFITEAQGRLKELLSDALRSANLPFTEVSTMATPRRLACVITGLAAKQETTSKKVKGPPVKDSFDENKKPLIKAEKFAEKHQLTVDKLDQEDIGGTVYLVANLTIEGLKAQDVLSEIMPKVISQLSGERLMRWGSSDLKFSRPIRWLVSLLDSEVVPFSMGDGINAGRQSFGHRILAPGAITIDTAQKYGESLKKSFVIVCPDERRDLIQKQVTEVAGQLKGRAKLLKGPLLEEVVNLTEWPCAVAGDFATEYLELPDTLIETIMVHHQRYFPVTSAEKDSTNGTSVRSNNLLPHFITISNNDRDSAKDSIKKGNERVLKARLADGRFFYFDDQKTKFADQKEKLGQLTFQEGLGSYLDKTNRLVKLANELAAQLNLEARLKICLERSAELCKVDLVTNLVRELPELQGYVGSWYAESEKEPPDVVHAIASHYSPRSTDDSIAGDEVGRLTAVVDKIDHVVGLFALGKKPSGSSDPFALRRQAQGLVDTVIDGLAKYPVNVSALINSLLESYEPLLSNLKTKKEFDKEKVHAEVSDFILQRLRGKLLDLSFSKEAVDAVLASRDPLQNLPDVVTRCKALDELIKSDHGLLTMKAGVRVANILKPDSHQTADPKLFTLDAEKNLWKVFNDDVASKWSGLEPKLPTTIDEYKNLLALLQNLAKPVDAFFDDVLVDDPDQEKRKNRHGLLYTIDRYFKCVGDFRKLRSLLPS